MALKEIFHGMNPGPNGPYVMAEAVTKDDHAVIKPAYRGLYVGTGGTLTVIMRDGGEVQLTNVPNGTFLPLWVKGVKATGSSASNIIGFV